MSTKFDRDPEALAWARSHVQRQVERMERFITQAEREGKDAKPWKAVRHVLHSSLIGGAGCVIAAFDERRPSLPTECVHGFALDDGTHRCGDGL